MTKNSDLLFILAGAVLLYVLLGTSQCSPRPACAAPAVEIVWSDTPCASDPGACRLTAVYQDGEVVSVDINRVERVGGSSVKSRAPVLFVVFVAGCFAIGFAVGHWILTNRYR